MKRTTDKAIGVQLIELFLYSNLWIAGAAVAMSWQTRWILTGQLHLNKLDGFIFCATLFLYAVHRLIALERLQLFTSEGRFSTIARRRRDIIGYALLAGGSSLFFFLQLPRSLQYLALAPAILSFLYVTPIFRGGRRLRDFHYLKIFLIAFVWTWVTVLLPASEQHLAGQLAVIPMACERLLFIFAITIPFDIRDLHIDQHTRVHTLPSRLGSRQALRIAILLLVASGLFSWLLFRIDAYSSGMWVGWIISAVVAGSLIWGTTARRSDYYFTGWLDGTMILQFALLYGLDLLF